ncbi:hypothetical protein OF83DRAFT_1172800 [Amylostereum chailletii]|nr:hypothetical protein OF83DRAFT_1172800 [Amylostereum chailletii]
MDGISEWTESEDLHFPLIFAIAQYSHHDPALAHSRHTSETFDYPSVVPSLPIAVPFKPGTFTFQPSGPNVPKLTFTFPLLQPPASEPVQMQLSSSSPPQASQASAKLNAAAHPFTLPSHSTFAIREPVGSTFSPREPMALPKSPRVLQLSPEPENEENDSDEEGPALAHQLPIPPTMKAQRAPIPLDFKPPVSTNTVPAGLFKTLGNDEDEATRRTVRSRLSSREFFEYEHPKRSHSLDDVSTMPAISRNEDCIILVRRYPHEHFVHLGRVDPAEPHLAEVGDAALRRPAGCETQAVKSHISQLIDLTSNKRETVGLMTDKLIPILPSIYPPSTQTLNIDMAAVISQITNEVRWIVAPVDAHGIKEQVSDLVVVRLDSRLGVPNRALDAFSSKVTEGVESLAQPVKVAVAKMSDAIAVQTGGLASLHGDLLGLLADWPAKLADATDALNVARADLATRGPETQGARPKTLDNGLLAPIHHELLARFTELAEPMAVIKAIKAIQAMHVELLTRSVAKEDFEEVRIVLVANADI